MGTQSDVRNKAIDVLNAALEYVTRRTAQSPSPKEFADLSRWNEILQQALLQLQSAPTLEPGDPIANDLRIEQLILIASQISRLHEYYSLESVDQVLSTLTDHLGRFSGSSGPGGGNPI
jgi:hypothetical protein